MGKRLVAHLLPFLTSAALASGAPFLDPVVLEAQKLAPAGPSINPNQSSGVKDGVPSLDVRPTATPPLIDGVIDDLAWRGATHSDSFRQVEPLENAAPTERTEFWVTYDPDTIYVAIRCQDSAGLAGLRATNMQRDRDHNSDDYVRLVLDTFHRENDGYYFGLTAAGGQQDGLIQNKAEANAQWDALWLGKVTRDAGGWSAEFAIPVRSLAFDPAIDIWGFNLARTVSRKHEVMRWSGFVRGKPTTSLPDLGELRGLAGLRQGRGFDFKPFASLTHRSAPGPDEKEIDFRPGLDLIWHPTPSLAATLTVNTDFADAEVDERQVNLGRFPLFFPEKRAFFLQDASLFAFGGISDGLTTPYFSRRIGLADDGSKIDILAGAKLTGRLGRVTLGLFDVQMAAHGGIDSKNLLVARAAVQVLDESSVGLLVTNGEPRTNGSSQTVGVDFNFLNSHLPGSKTLEAHAYAIGTDGDFAGGRGTDVGVAVNYPNEPFEFVTDNRRISDRFDPALGYAPRAGIYECYNALGYTWRPEAHGLRTVKLGLQAYWTLDLHGRVLDEDHDLPELEFQNDAGDELKLEFTHARERLDAPFEIQPGIVIPAGDYQWERIEVGGSTTRARAVSLNLRFRDQGFYTGHRRDYRTSIEWRASRFFFTSAAWDLRQVRLPEGDFDVRTGEVQAVFSVSPDLQFSLLAQYDNLSAELGLNFRAKWTVQPGNDLYFIINQGYDTSLDRLRPTANETSLKGAWTYRF